VVHPTALAHVIVIVAERIGLHGSSRSRGANIAFAAALCVQRVYDAGYSITFAAFADDLRDRASTLALACARYRSASGPGTPISTMRRVEKRTAIIDAVYFDVAYTVSAAYFYVASMRLRDTKHRQSGN
jgi:hypothetical protein